MTAWLIITAKISDREKFISGYAAEAAKLVERYGGRYTIRAPGAAQLEGDGWDGASVVVSEWASREAARAFWDSEEYAAVKKLREGICEAQVLLIGD